MENLQTGKVQGQVSTKLNEQQKVGTMLSETIHTLFQRLNNIVREEPNVDRESDAKEQVLVPLARDIESNTNVLRKLITEVEDFTRLLEN